MDKTNQDVVGEKCMKNDAGELSLSDDQKMKSWVQYYSSGLVTHLIILFPPQVLHLP